MGHMFLSEMVGLKMLVTISQSVVLVCNLDCIIIFLVITFFSVFDDSLFSLSVLLLDDILRTSNMGEFKYEV